MNHICYKGINLGDLNNTNRKIYDFVNDYGLDFKYPYNFKNKNSNYSEIKFKGATKDE